MLPAWDADELLQMLRSFEQELQPFDRHLLLERIVDVTYKHRKASSTIRDLCECVAWVHFDEFPSLLDHIPKYVDGRIYPPKTFPKLATILTEKGAFDLAVMVCEKAIAWELEDGTKSGYEGRIQRIEKSARKAGTDLTFTGPVLQRKITRNCDGIISTIRYELQASSKQRAHFKNLETRIERALEDASERVLAMSPRKAIPELLRIRESFTDDSPGEKSLRYYCSRWASDFYILLGEYQKALEVCPDLYRDAVFNLKLLLGERLTGQDVIRFFGVSNLTDFGRENLIEVEQQIDQILASHEQQTGMSIVEEWMTECEQRKYRLFSSSIVHFREIDIPEYLFEESPRSAEYIERFKDIIRQAENEVREKHGVPYIGEGWVAETQLYYAIKEAFTDLEVQQHASPEWLGRQHLDIFLPELNIAIEYQGAQHDEPIDFFGGEEAFAQTQERDRRKRELCEANGVKLVYVRPGYIFEDLIKEIEVDQIKK